MKKHFNKTARHAHYHRSVLDFYGSPHYSPYYAYPPVVFTVYNVLSEHIQQNVPVIWTPRLLQDKYSQLMPPTVINIAADYIGRFMEAI
jgi:hypothetical protein